MAIQLFGFQFGKESEKKKQEVNVPSFSPPPNDDGSYEIAPGGSYGTYVDLESTAKNEGDLVTKYRELSLQPEVESAIDDIVNDSIIREDNKNPVEINLDNLQQPDRVKERIRTEFKNVLKLLDFQNMGYDIYRRWYIDGRLYYHMMIDVTSPRKGLQEIRYIDPRRIRKIRQEVKSDPTQRTSSNPYSNQVVTPAFTEYYLYSAATKSTSPYTKSVKIAKDSIVYVHSGLLDQKNAMVLSFLHKAIKPMNQLRMLEDATVIYRMSRAPERRIFYIDVGNLPKLKAEQYLRDMMVKHKNRLVYNATTGEVQDDRKFMTMLEDFWLPRREGGKGTEITTLPGGQNLGEMTDVEYFRQKVYKSLSVPVTRIQTESSFNLGRTGEITRDEVKFSRFIDRLRQRFTHLFDKTLEVQLVLTGVMSKQEWKDMKETIHYDFLRDNYFAELKDQEIMNARLGIIQNIDPFVGKYFSTKYVREKILHLTEDESKEMEDDIAQELKDNPPEQDVQQAPAAAKPKVVQKTPVKKEELEIKTELSREEQILIENMTKAIDEASGVISEENEKDGL